MLPILIINTEKLNSQVILSTSRLTEDTWSFTLNNTTNNTYKIFLESCLIDNTGELISKKTSKEFQLSPGIITISEKEIGDIISNQIHKDEQISSGEVKFSICVKQKYGPDLGFQNIELK